MTLGQLIGEAETSAEEVVVACHERTKHHSHRYATPLGTMDWTTQPDPFRRYAGAELVRRPLPKSDHPLPYWQLYSSASVPPMSTAKHLMQEQQSNRATKPL